MAIAKEYVDAINRKRRELHELTVNTVLAFLRSDLNIELDDRGVDRLYNIIEFHIKTGLECSTRLRPTCLSTRIIQSTDQAEAKTYGGSD